MGRKLSQVRILSLPLCLSGASLVPRGYLHSFFCHKSLLEIRLLIVLLDINFSFGIFLRCGSVESCILNVAT